MKRFLIEFKSDRHAKHFMIDFEINSITRDKYMLNGDIYRQLGNDDGIVHQFIQLGQNPIIITKGAWRDISENIIISYHTYPIKNQLDIKLVSVNKKRIFWIAEAENNEKLSSCSVLEKYFHIKEIGEVSLLDISKEFVE